MFGSISQVRSLLVAYLLLIYGKWATETLIGDLAINGQFHQITSYTVFFDDVISCKIYHLSVNWSLKHMALSAKNELWTVA